MTDKQKHTHTQPKYRSGYTTTHTHVDPGPGSHRSPIRVLFSSRYPRSQPTSNQLRCLATPHLLPTEHDLLPPSTIITHLPLAITISIPSIAAPPHGTGFCKGEFAGCCDERWKGKTPNLRVVARAINLAANTAWRVYTKNRLFGLGHVYMLVCIPYIYRPRP